MLSCRGSHCDAWLVCVEEPVLLTDPWGQQEPELSGLSSELVCTWQGTGLWVVAVFCVLFKRKKEDYDSEKNAVSLALVRPLCG